ncbi:hypothetical protein OV208_15560 [Corallococcus sp. bb12-1]|uniref:hypothetical protein n=1 Tax=Corallococcus sp. bb12-1 TaxID=2996784 RepID=UPI00226FD0BD|nr:hypothetical protein [Corallococcus sp. bb12-1]MCY1042741.1 hypothetical protein [Corallococcus sp. bb12-1]
MNSLSMSIHDAAVVGIHSNLDDEALTLDLVLEDKRELLLEFKGAQHWNLEGYRPQNVLFGIYEWRAGEEKTAQVCEELGLSEGWVESILAGELVVFELDPSVGLGGYVLARSMEVRPASSPKENR